MKTYPTVVKFPGGGSRILEMTAEQRGRTENDLDREVVRRAHGQRFTHDVPIMREDYFVEMQRNMRIQPLTKPQALEFTKRIRYDDYIYNR